MLNILFVDDDALILAGLNRKFRRFADTWRMNFVTSGDEALQRLAKSSFDVVITDLRMPSMDGGELLRRVKQLYPGILRVILSGQSGQEGLFRTLGPAHQFMLKPCDPATMQDVIDRGVALQKRLVNSKIENLVGQIPLLSNNLPKIFYEIVEEATSNQASIDQVGQAIARDQALTANLMNLLNSASSPMLQPVNHPTEAGKLLGLDMLKSLVICIGAFNQFERNAVCGFSFDQMLQHSIEVGQLAKQIVRGVVDNEYIAHDALLAGMLHDVGKLALATCDKFPYHAVLQLAHQKNLTLWQAEQAVLGVTHAEIGGYLLNTWGFAQSVVEAVALHHEPAAFGGTRFSALSAVHIADGMIHERTPKWLQETSARIDSRYLASLDNHLKIAEWMTQDTQTDAELIEA